MTPPIPPKKPHFSLLATSFAGGPRPRNTALILGGLWLLVFFAALWAPPLLDDADATHANAARAMALSGDLVTLRVDGVRYLEKAPLPYWLAALSIRCFGANAFAVHLPQALAVLLLMLLGHRWANQAFGARTGFYTSLAILTATGVFLFTRIFIPEVLLSLLLAAALFAFLKAISPNPLAPVALPGAIERPAIAWYAGPLFYPAVLWSSIGLAVLTKGLIALVFFFGAAGLFLLLTCPAPADLRRTLARLYPVSGILLLLAIAAPWHILAALRNPPSGAPTTPGSLAGHGFLWFYFVNEHFLRFLGRRIPRDYNKLPDTLYWTLHLVWLFPWALFLPLGALALWHRIRAQLDIRLSRVSPAGIALAVALPVGAVALFTHADPDETLILGPILAIPLLLLLARRRAHLPLSPFHQLDPQQRTTLLCGLFSALILCFFSLSTNQEYYTFPAYLPLLLLIAATITRAEQTYSTNPQAVRWVNLAHAAFAVLGACFSLALLYGLFASRHLPFVPDIGDLLAHRGVGDYTLSMSHLFDLTAPSFAALRLPAALAAVTFAIGPLIAWWLRTQRRHLAATTAIAFTMALFLVAAHIALVRFGPMLSSEDLAAKIQELEDDRQVSRETQVLLYGDQAYGSSIPFYLGEQVDLVNARSSSMLFGSTFPEAQSIFLSNEDLRAMWGRGERKILFVPLEKRDEVDRLHLPHALLLEETSGKALYTDRPLNVNAGAMTLE